MQGLGLRTNDPQTRAYYDLLRRLAERAIITWVKWPILGVIDSVDYYDGQGQEYLTLRYPFTTKVSSIYVNNTGAGNQAANAFTSAYLLTAGTDYMVEYEGGGTSTGQPGQLCKSGRVVMLNNSLFWFPSDFVWFRSSGGLGYKRPAVWPAGYGNIKVVSDWGFTNGLAVTAASYASGVVTFTTASAHGLYAQQSVNITGAVPDGWNGQYTTLSVPSATTFTAAISADQGAITTNGSLNSVPEDIQLALITAVGQLRSTVKYGGAINNESGGKYNASVNIGMDAMFGTVRQLLSPYRNIALAGFA